jgi:hypothetical protein
VIAFGRPLVAFEEFEILVGRIDVVAVALVSGLPALQRERVDVVLSGLVRILVVRGLPGRRRIGVRSAGFRRSALS